jgi:hypothetical protein
VSDVAEIRLSTGRARAVVSTTAGMLLDASFTLDGVEHRPFARAPWLDAPGNEDLDGQPGHLRVLGGEFVAVPFGSVGAPEPISPEWSGVVPAASPLRPHGPSADDEWMIVESTGDSVILALDYAEPSGIRRLERSIRIREDAPALDFSLTLHARRPVDTAVGLHPILRLPTTPGALELAVEFERGFTYPGPVWPGAGPTRPGQTFSSLDSVPAHAGTVDLSRLPLERPTEDVVLLAGATSALHARFLDSMTHVMLDWDRGIVPHLMLWLSDAVLEETPWNGRYRGLGVEPIAAAFDFPNEVSIGANPLAEAGFRTQVHVEPEAPVCIRYSVTCLPFANMYDVNSAGPDE